MTLLLAIAIAFVVAYCLGHHWAPRGLQSFLTPLLVAALFYILGFAAWALVKPSASMFNLMVIVLVAVIALYAIRRLWGRIEEKRNP
jgi:uncharacterized membrane protein